MMYGNKLAAAIKINGKVLREFKDTVYVPFGTEYTILVKNLNTTRALVNIFIDGDNVVPGGLVINAGQEINLERSIKNGNLSEGNRFKFIERTGTIEEHRGIKLEDGLVRIEYQFERPPVVTALPTYGWNTIYSTTTTATSYNVNGIMRSVDTSPNGAAVQAQATSAVNNYCAVNNIKAGDNGSATMDCCLNDVGITVPGSRSTQQFTTTHIQQLEAEDYVMIIKLLGETPDNKLVTQAVTVKHKPKCVTCGKQNKAHAKFCSECGTALEIFA